MPALRCQKATLQHDKQQLKQHWHKGIAWNRTREDNPACTLVKLIGAGAGAGAGAIQGTARAMLTIVATACHHSNALVASGKGQRANRRARTVARAKCL